MFNETGPEVNVLLRTSFVQRVLLRNTEAPLGPFKPHWHETDITEWTWLKDIRNGPYFGEVADDVRSLFVDLSEDVEDKRLHVKIKRLVVEK